MQTFASLPDFFLSALFFDSSRNMNVFLQIKLSVVTMEQGAFK